MTKLSKPKTSKKSSLQKKQNEEFFIKEKAFECIKDKFKDHILLFEGKGFFVIAYKKNLKVQKKLGQHTFHPFESIEDCDLGVLRVVAYKSLRQSKDLDYFLNIKAEYSYFDPHTHTYQENIVIPWH